MSLTLQKFQYADEFLDCAGELLKTGEVRNGLTISLASRLAASAQAFGVDAAWLYVIRDGPDICAAAIRTPPHHLVLSYFQGDPEQIAETACKAIFAEHGDIPGVIGENGLAKVFLETWCRISGASVVGTTNQRIYQMRELIPPRLPGGTFRIAGPDDTAIIARWSLEMHHEIFGPATGGPVEFVEKRVAGGDLYLWECGVPVSMAAKCRPVGHGITVNAVYTPKALRNRGYASACVYSLCRLLLDSGYEYVSLYTDLANPTSNGIYQRLGFRAVCDSTQALLGSKSGK